MTSEHYREDLILDEDAAMNQAEERYQLYEGFYPDNLDAKQQQIPPRWNSPVRQELPMPAQYHQPINASFPPPTLIQRQSDVLDIIYTGPGVYTGPGTLEVFTNLMNYQYSTRASPQLQSVSGPVAEVINTLYTRIDELETTNAVLLHRLGNAQDALDEECQRNTRQQAFYFV